MLLTRGEWEQYEVENLETGLVTGWGEGEKDWDPAWSEPACSKHGSSTIQIEDTPEKISYTVIKKYHWQKKMFRWQSCQMDPVIPLPPSLALTVLRVPQRMTTLWP